MELFGMGPGEMMVVLILALIVFGPGKLPEIARGMGKAVREFQKATSQITEELTREIQPDTPAQQAPQAQAPAPQPPTPQEPQAEALAASVEAQNGPLVLEIKRPTSNGAATAHEEVPPTVQTAPAEAPVAEAPAAEIAPKPPRVRRPRKPKAEPAIDMEAGAVVATPAEATAEAVPSAEPALPAKPRRRRKVAEVTEPIQD